MGKQNTKRYSKEQLKAEEQKEIEKINENLCIRNYTFIFVIFNLIGDYLCYVIDKFWGLENIIIPDSILRICVKIGIPILLAIFFRIYQKRIRQGFNKFIWNLIFSIILFSIIAYIYFVTNK